MNNILFPQYTTEYISNTMSLRKPQEKSLQIPENIVNNISLDSNRYNAVVPVSDVPSAVPEKTFRAGLYARLSVEISEKPTNSIQTQLDIMRSYVDRHPEIIEAFEYTDSGFSGTDFERPDFNRLMEDVRAGRINCILVKDDCAIIGLNQKNLTNTGV